MRGVCGPTRSALAQDDAAFPKNEDPTMAVRRLSRVGFIVTNQPVAPGRVGRRLLRQARHARTVD
jgi:hypothetical protein